MEKIDKKAIDDVAKLVRFEIYQRAKRSHSTVPHVLQLLRPEHAARVHGVEYEEVAGSLGVHGVGKETYEVAGLIDPQRNLIRVSGKFSYEIQRFTGAHELGHHFLHRGMSLHRDRPLDGSLTGLDKREREANYFAGTFLAPEQIAKRAYAARFGSKPLHLTDDVAFALKGAKDMHDLMRTSGTGSRQLARAIAGATQFGPGRRFDSLASVFGLSITAMAIRLEEIGLVEEVSLVND
ncbi:hypothetical protein DSC91_007379 [Paraburkholderia caffeinilytica]|uniref:IrrE N-terminal-like domain-containing protein n=1 Tax=Paraburkholderia caffeinilytica TaxID=1761016 RepID=A0ABQ1NCZ5_9BURK|nr:ImmA/IrrE family metallo-endopeptidase [Paraburkholderia caffeinilytica]AXL53767.1 hypothetical protein DSC91_007379 [Paraburkholderia caffeinilytica]GGC63477.1 hypothetical protein GCM10011400_59160 [Paraburkholderia caffeinilytica]CAB3799819.1 hypothetical protein LMG28690_05011 [Paraburkholderia caffeinilytica]